MARKFSGTLEELKKLISAAGILGEWLEQNGKKPKHIFRSEGGGVLNWWPSTRTLQFQGDPAETVRLADALGNAASGQTEKPAPAAAVSAKREPQIFVVHGHDREARDQVELALMRLGLKPFILMNSSGGGDTIIEALEGKIGRDSPAAFGVVLVTPDDMGRPKNEPPAEDKPRARENVILEAGMLLASLTRKRIALLVKGHVELPSDLAGLIHLRFNDNVREVLPKLCDRMREAGIEINPQAISAALA